MDCGLDEGRGWRRKSDFRPAVPIDDNLLAWLRRRGRHLSPFPQSRRDVVQYPVRV